MVSPLTITLFLICFCCVFILLRLSHARFGEPADRVMTLWLAPVVVLPIATYFCFFAGVPLIGWTLLACGGSIMVGAVLEGAHIRSARISIDVPHRTLHLEGSSPLVLIGLMLLDAICYTTLLMLMLSVFPALHTSFFRRFAPELALFSLGSRGIHALLLFLFWKKAQQQQTLADATTQR